MVWEGVAVESAERGDTHAPSVEATAKATNVVPICRFMFGSSPLPKDAVDSNPTPVVFKRPRGPPAWLAFRYTAALQHYQQQENRQCSHYTL